MKVLSKNSDELILLAIVSDTVRKGDYLLIEDGKLNRKMIVQIYDEDYLSSQTLIEDIVRDEVINASSAENLHDPLNIGKLSRMIRDARLFRTKIRGTIDTSGRMSRDFTWIPSRVQSKIRRLSIPELDAYVCRTGNFPIKIGKTRGDNEEFDIYADDLDGKLNIVTGRKECGKSHLAKILIKRLVEHGAFVVVFDLNDEYSGLAINHDGSPSSLANQIKVLQCGDGLTFSLEYCGKAAISNVLKNALDTPAASMREFFRIWDWLDNKDCLNIEALGKAVNTWNVNELVRDALISRFHLIQGSRLFLQNRGEGVRFEKIFSKGKGAAIVVCMAKITPIVRRMIVELILNKLVDLLENEIIPPIFLFAEEAHLYLRDTYWEDITSRMRHFGICPTFITNQPDAIGDAIYRQVDNIFLFNFTNDADLDRISRVSLADNDTIRSIVKTLSHRHCLAIGKMVSDLPVVVEVAELEMLAFGETRKFFSRRVEQRF